MGRDLTEIENMVTKFSVSIWDALHSKFERRAYFIIRKYNNAYCIGKLREMIICIGSEKHKM